MNEISRCGTWFLGVRTMILMAVCGGLGLGSPVAVSATAQGGDTSEGGPAQVTVGMYLCDVPSVDLREGIWAFDAYLWLVWDSTKFQSTGTDDHTSALPRSPADVYEVMGVHELIATLVASRPGYAAFRLRGKVRQQFDLERFPLDEQGARRSCTIDKEGYL